MMGRARSACAICAASQKSWERILMMMNCEYSFVCIRTVLERTAYMRRSTSLTREGSECSLAGPLGGAGTPLRKVAVTLHQPKGPTVQAESAELKSGACSHCDPSQFMIPEKVAGLLFAAERAKSSSAISISHLQRVFCAFHLLGRPPSSASCPAGMLHPPACPPDKR